MSAARKGLASRDLDRLFRRGVVPDGDGALLAEFLAGGDESAFETIVARHGPMVLGVCRRLLGDPHDADDAFQATFLVLVRKAGQIRDADRLGPWLYGVATRVATKARARDVRRKSRMVGPVDLPSPLEDRSDWLDVRPILDAELGRLPAKFRDILVLCLFEGSTLEEAARRLSWPLGTVKSRLARGREALRSRLTVRGVAPAVAAAVAAGSARSAVASPVSQPLSRATLRVVGLLPDRVPPGVAALTRGVAPRMLRTSRILTAVAFGGLALGGIGLVTRAKSQPVASQAPRDDPDRLRVVSIDHMKSILLALHNYDQVNGRFPPVAIAGADGTPLLSWRVAILPYLEQQALFNEFHLDEPWDSPHNNALIARMPDVFATPSSPAGPGTTRIRGFAGAGAMFEASRGVAIQDVFDGTSNTLMFAAGREAVPWSKPGELAVAKGKPLPGLDDTDEKGVLVGIADGSVRYIPAEDQALLKMLITRAAGEVVAWPPAPQVRGNQEPAPRPAAESLPTPTATPPLTPAAAPGPASPIPPDLDRRLRGIEDKLDRLIRKLDAAGEGDEKR